MRARLLRWRRAAGKRVVLGEGEAVAALFSGEEWELFGMRGERGDGDADEADGFWHRHAGPDGGGAMEDISAA